MREPLKSKVESSFFFYLEPAWTQLTLRFFDVLVYPIGSMVLIYMLTLGVYWWDPCYHTYIHTYITYIHIYIYIFFLRTIHGSVMGMICCFALSLIPILVRRLVANKTAMTWPWHWISQLVLRAVPVDPTAVPLPLRRGLEPVRSARLVAMGFFMCHSIFLKGNLWWNLELI